MRGHGFVTEDDDAYRLGLQFFNYGQYVRTQFQVYEAAKSAIDELAATTGEVVWLFVHGAGRVLHPCGNTRETGVDVENVLGSWEYMHCMSRGKPFSHTSRTGR